MGSKLVFLIYSCLEFILFFVIHVCIYICINVDMYRGMKGIHLLCNSFVYHCSCRHASFDQCNFIDTNATRTKRFGGSWESKGIRPYYGILKGLWWLEILFLGKSCIGGVPLDSHEWCFFFNPPI